MNVQIIAGIMFFVALTTRRWTLPKFFISSYRFSSMIEAGIFYAISVIILLLLLPLEFISKMGSTLVENIVTISLLASFFLILAGVTQEIRWNIARPRF